MRRLSSHLNSPCIITLKEKKGKRGGGKGGGGENRDEQIVPGNALEHGSRVCLSFPEKKRKKEKRKKREKKKQSDLIAGASAKYASPPLHAVSARFRSFGEKKKKGKKRRGRTKGVTPATCGPSIDLRKRKGKGGGGMRHSGPAPSCLFPDIPKEGGGEKKKKKREGRVKRGGEDRVMGPGGRRSLILPFISHFLSAICKGEKKKKGGGGKRVGTHTARLTCCYTVTPSSQPLGATIPLSYQERKKRRGEAGGTRPRSRSRPGRRLPLLVRDSVFSSTWCTEKKGRKGQGEGHRLTPDAIVARDGAGRKGREKRGGKRKKEPRAKASAGVPHAATLLLFEKRKKGEERGRERHAHQPLLPFSTDVIQEKRKKKERKEEKSRSLSGANSISR